MSKIKSTRLEPRTPQGTLTIGTEEGPSTTQFEGTVIIPDYATIEYVDQIVTGDIAVELGAYQSRDEKNQAAGYAGLDDTGRVPANRIDTDTIESEVADHHERIDTNTAKIAQLESATAFQIEYYMGNLSGTDPAASYMSINAPLWEDTTQIKINKTDAGGAVHDFTGVKAGDTIWFADVTADGIVSADVDTSGLYTVTSVSVGDVTTFDVAMQSANGGPSVGDRVESQLFPSFDISSKADITYVDSQDKWIKDNYLPLSGGTSHKMAADIYMQTNSIKGLKGEKTHTNDAVSYSGGNREYLRRDGVDTGLTGDLDMGSNTIDNVGGVEMDQGAAINWAIGDPGGQIAYGGNTKLTVGSASVSFKVGANMNNKDISNVSRIHLNGDREIDVASGTAALLKYDGDDKFKWGNGLWAYANLDMGDNKVVNVETPTADADAATKKYVDDSTPIEIGTSTAPPNRPKGSLYLTTGGNVYAYT